MSRIFYFVFAEVLQFKVMTTRHNHGPLVLSGNYPSHMTRNMLYNIRHTIWEFR